MVSHAKQQSPKGNLEAEEMYMRALRGYKKAWGAETQYKIGSTQGL
jgi:hypothetical protein